MRVFIFLLTLVLQNLGGNSLNSSLGASNSVLGMQFRTKIAESSRKNFVILSASEESKNNPSLRANPQDLRGNPPIEKSTELQGRLPRSRTLARNDEILDYSLRLRSARNDKIGAENDRNSARIAESALDSAPSKQEANSSIFDEKSGLRSHERGNRTNEFIDEASGKLPDLSQKDAEFATCKDDITGFWLSPLDKVSARTSIIEIFKKDGKYFAYNVAFLDELPPKKDVLNQNFALRDREILGSIYAYNLERSGEVSYINGRYYDFNRGKIFHLKAKLDCDKLILLISADNVGFLGKKKIYKALQKSEAEFYIKTRPTIDFSGVK